MTKKFVFTNDQGMQLAGRLEIPAGGHRGAALFAHCFTCSKDSLAAARVSRALTDSGLAVLRFDFTGLGQSEGDFGNTNFSSNVSDLVAAARALTREGYPPQLLIGHSLGGAAVLAAAPEIEECRGVVTIGTPAEPSHVKNLGRPLLIFHSPIDSVVAIDNARKLYEAARHPKSFISLDQADHLLSKEADAVYVATTVAAWASRYLTEGKSETELEAGEVMVETAGGKFTQLVSTPSHRLLADEPASVGGQDRGPGPYDLLLAALGTCSAMTLQMYAARKQIQLDQVRVKLSHRRVHAADCAECENREGRLEVIDRKIELQGRFDEKQRERMMEIADRCPVHRTLLGSLEILTSQL